ncbi:DUF4244 domain-containing protein [Kribbella deserti]|uniref:DUF4244 domain-containing protein n=1 Tax=Kribbella deserti TaxID=1926257 RepID=A0ABV6QSM4_9ACTN
MSKTLVAVQHRPLRGRMQAGRDALVHAGARFRTGLAPGRDRGEQGAATAEYAVATVAACGFGGILITLLKSDTMLSLLKAIINAGLRAAGIEFEL